MTTKLAYFVKNGKDAEALAVVNAFNTVCAENVTFQGGNTKVVGLVLHVSKGKKCQMSKKFGEKSAKLEVSYYRLVFFRENGPTGDVFAVIFGQDDKDKDTFLLSNVVIGTGSFIVKPSLEGEWMGMRLLKTGEPFLPAAFVNQPFLPKVFPSTGFVAFTLQGVGLFVQRSAHTKTCSGTLCGGLYGIDKCPCVSTSQLPRHVIAFELAIQGIDDNDVRSDLSGRLGLKLPDFISTSFTDALVNQADLQMSAKANDDTIIMILDHAEAQLNDGKWTVTGWWKASSVAQGDGVAMVTPKCHIVSLTKEGTPIVKWVRP